MSCDRWRHVITELSQLSKCTHISRDTLVLRDSRPRVKEVSNYKDWGKLKGAVNQADTTVLANKSREKPREPKGAKNGTLLQPNCTNRQNTTIWSSSCCKQTLFSLFLLSSKTDVTAGWRGEQRLWIM